jgi:hypothetical protein
LEQRNEKCSGNTESTEALRKKIEVHRMWESAVPADTVWIEDNEPRS